MLAIAHVNPAWADGYECAGSDPDWSLKISEESATFDYFDRTSEMTIPQKSIAEGADWPRALTLIGPRDSAIVVLAEQTCGLADYAAHVLTQRGETPILITGCCTRTDRQ